ncbi:hypothetical protein SAMN05428959_104502 [Duganella sp. CF517]|uniref:hypothetical protein n=1 Tax=Duganella sp. CF517 TaxID=1881038 RepID=UPI0008BA93FE|nr:hypothetical protein [Duganella sp. CF517]SEO07124.1 hypothetical protein SAMN05428959_104502 [Duganella sp. CF517]
MSTFPASTSFVNILVFVKPSATLGQYDVITAPAVPIITEPDTVINYQLFDTDGYDIVFTGMSVEPSVNSQLSVATVSMSGKMLTFSDANTETMGLNINLKFKNNSKEGEKFAHDPQIINTPQT